MLLWNYNVASGQMVMINNIVQTSSHFISLYGIIFKVSKLKCINTSPIIFLNNIWTTEQMFLIYHVKWNVADHIDPMIFFVFFQNIINFCYYLQYSWTRFMYYIIILLKKIVNHLSPKIIFVSPKNQIVDSLAFGKLFQRFKSIFQFFFYC